MRRIKTLVTVWRPRNRSSMFGHDVPSDEDLRASAPGEVDFRFLEPGQKLGEHLGGVEVLYGPLPEEDFSKADSLRWVQLNSTGADTMMYDAFARSGILLTTLGGAITVTVAEHALALLFALARNLHLQRDFQRERKWQAAWGVEITGMRLGLLGFGRIGRAIASRAHAFGMDIKAVDAYPRDKPDFVTALWGLDRLTELLKTSDALLCTVPKTPSTSRMISAEQLTLMPPGSFIVNIGRGGVIDEAALLHAVQKGPLGGVALDVAEVEPLPTESLLWDEPRILITPHTAGFSQNLRQKKIDWFVNNLRRYINGQRLEGLVDPSRGF